MAPPTWMEKEEKRRTRSGKEFGGRRSLGKAKEHHQHRLASEMLRWDRGGSHVVFTLGFSFQRDSSSEICHGVVAAWPGRAKDTAAGLEDSYQGQMGKINMCLLCFGRRE